MPKKDKAVTTMSNTEPTVQPVEEATPEKKAAKPKVKAKKGKVNLRTKEGIVAHMNAYGAFCLNRNRMEILRDQSGIEFAMNTGEPIFVEGPIPVRHTKEGMVVSELTGKRIPRLKPYDVDLDVAHVAGFNPGKGIISTVDGRKWAVNKP